MAEVFLKVVNMSICASWMVVGVLAARVFLKKAPKGFSLLLWALVGLRLACPFSLESVFSLIPSSNTVPPEIMEAPVPSVQTGVPFLDNAVNPVISQTFAADPSGGTNSLQLLIPLAATVWSVGAVVLAAYAVGSYLRVKLQLREATLYKENIYWGENISSPVVFGFVKPMIYLPYNMQQSDIQYVIAHEQAHIQRKDHWWKPIGFLLMSIHWFNPVIWLAYIFFCRDIEMSCDEKVVKTLSPEQRANYSDALLACSINRRRIVPSPLAFGEISIKERIRAVLHYKKPTLWVLIVAVVLCVVIAGCGLTNPIAGDDDPVKDPGFTVADPYIIPVFTTSSIDIHARSEQIKAKLDTTGSYSFRISDIGALTYYRGESESDITPIQISDEEAVRKAQEYLKELGLLPESAYRTAVSRVSRGAVNPNDGSEATPETISVDVRFYRIFNGVDVITDQEDGILISFDAQGICALRYLWRNIELQTIVQKTETISSDEAHRIYMEQWDDRHGACCDPCENPEIFQAYAQFNGVSRLCWVVAENTMYLNAWCIDAFTGEVVYW